MFREMFHLRACGSKRGTLEGYKYRVPSCLMGGARDHHHVATNRQ